MAETTELQLKITAQDEASKQLQELTQWIKELETRLSALQSVKVDQVGLQTWQDTQAKIASTTAQLSEAQGQLKPHLDAVKTATKEAAEAQKEHDAALKAASASTGGLITSFTAASLAADAITASIRGIAGIFKDSVAAANGYQNAMSGLTSTAQTFGTTSDAATTAAKRLTADGLLSMTDAATGLKNLLSSGLNIDQATQLMDVYKDRAAFGRQNTIQYGQAVQNLAESFKTQSSQIGNLSGMTENYNQIIAVGAGQLGKSASSLDAAELAQAKYLGTLALSNGATGDAARFAETYAGQQAILATSTQNAEIALGEGLQPALANLQKGFVSVLTGGMGDMNKNLPILQGNFLALSTGVRVAMDAVIGFGTMAVAAIRAVMDQSMTPLNEAWQTVGQTFTQTFADMDKGFQDIALGTNNATKAAAAALQQTSAAAATALRQMNEAIASENQSYAEAQASRLQSFNDTMQQMVTSHQQKVATIKGQIEDEATSYADAQARALAAYNDQTTSLEDSHLQKVADIQQQITDEKAKGIYVDGILYSQGDQQKLDKLQASLVKENDSYNDHLTKLKNAYDRQVAAAQEAEDKKMAALKKSLTEQEQILAAHAAEVTKYGNQQAQDDITILERKYAEEDAKALQHHNDQLGKIRQRAYDQGVAAGIGSNDGLAHGINASSTQVQQAYQQLGKDAAGAIQKGFANGGLQLNHQGNAGSTGSLGDFVKAMLGYPSEALNAGLGWASKLVFGFAGGTDSAPGGLALVGEEGPELVNLPRGSQVIPNKQTTQMLSGGGKGTVHIENFHNYAPTDLTAFSRELAWRLR